MRSVSFLLLIAVVVLVGCGGGDEAAAYEVRGRVVGSEYGGLALRIDHEPIPGYMEAMRMSFRLANPEEARLVQRGDKIRFIYVVTAEGSSIRNIELLPPETELDLPHLDDGEPSDTADVAADSLV